MRIIKLSVPLRAGKVELSEPGLGKAVSFDVDGDTALIWIKQQLDAPSRERHVVIVPDGDEFDPSLRHVGTAMTASKTGWHLFQYGP